MQIQITNPELYNKLVFDVDGTVETWLSESDFKGHVSIELEDGEKKEITGEHSCGDYEDEFGFIIIE